MNKKQHNRKLVAQNKRNKLINRRYISTIKTLFKLFLLTINKIKLMQEKKLEFGKQKIKKILTKNISSLEEEKQKILVLISKLSSRIDKAIKKKIIHKNTGARKKSKISRIFATI